MKNIKIWLILALITAIIAGCTSNSNSDENGVSTIEAVAETLESAKPISASFSNASVPGMKGVIENEQLQLFINDENGEIALYHKKSGKVLYSNPIERENDAIASGVNKDLLSAQLKIDYYNSYGQLNSINSYSDAVTNKQLSVETIDNGVAVTYQFGKDVKSSEDLPQKLSKNRFEELTGQMDKTGQRALLIAYKENKETGTYERNDSALQGLQLERAIQAFESIGYTEEDLMQDAQENNFTQTKPEPRIFFATIEYELDKDSLVVKVPVDKIIYPDEYPINLISVMSLFGSGGTSDQGSIFVPDGSGALIHFNNGKTKYASYQQSVYGSDMTMELSEDANQDQKARLPVFGIIQENFAWLGIIEQGESVATINADISGRLNSYNYVYPSFYVVNKGDVTLNANEQKRSLPKFQENSMKSDYAVRYVFLDKAQASYQGMANYYQQYLQDNNGLPERSTDEGSQQSEFYLELVGSISKKKHFAGIPYQAQVPLTTLEQAKEIIMELETRNISQMNVRYSGWFNGGLAHSVPTKIKVDSAIGGSKEIKNFFAFAENKGIQVYPDVALLLAKTDKNFNERKNAARSLRENPSRLFPVDLALDQRDRNKLPSYVISPRYVETYTSSMLKGMESINSTGIGLSDMADLLNSDFLKKKQIDRTESETISITALQAMSEKQFDLLADGGNAYALPYISKLANAPMSSSGYKIEDESIPFYQMVVRGYVEYTGSPYNLSTYLNDREYVLKTLEYGSNVYFKWIYEENQSIKETEHNDLYAMNYKIWLDNADAIYKEVDAFLSTVQEQRIIDHVKLDEGVYKTTYENGNYVIVNYNDTRVTVDGNTIEAEGYLTGGDAS